MSPQRKESHKRTKSKPNQVVRRSAKVVAKKVTQNRPKTPEEIPEPDLLPLPRTRSQHAAANCKILALNDDCLLEIFSHLPMMDLCAVKDSCRRFNVLADYTAKLAIQQLQEFDVLPKDDNQKDLAIFMQHFGKFVGKKIVLKTEATFNVKKVWLLLKHCTSLKELELVGVNVHGLPIHRMKKILQSVQVLQFKKCSGTDLEYARIINACVNLRSLTAFVNLTGGTDMLLGHIVHEASNIEEIFFASINSNSATFVENMAKLRHLKKLDLLFISCNNYQVAAAIDALAESSTLRYMLLREVGVDDDLGRALRKLTNLRLCYIQNEFEMSDSLRKSFEGFVDDGEKWGFFSYKYNNRP